MCRRFGGVLQLQPRVKKAGTLQDVVCCFAHGFCPFCRPFRVHGNSQTNDGRALPYVLIVRVRTIVVRLGKVTLGWGSSALSLAPSTMQINAAAEVAVPVKPYNQRIHGRLSLVATQAKKM